jgi:hypothetical protein
MTRIRSPRAYSSLAMLISKRTATPRFSRWSTVLSTIIQPANGKPGRIRLRMIRLVWESHDHPSEVPPPLPHRWRTASAKCRTGPCRRLTTEAIKADGNVCRHRMMLAPATGFISWRSRVSESARPPSSTQAGNEEGRDDKNSQGSTKLSPAMLG